MMSNRPWHYIGILIIFVLHMAQLPKAQAQLQAEAHKGRSAGKVNPQPSWNFVQARLKKAGFDEGFLNELRESYEPRQFDDVLKLNVLLFLRKSDYHGPQVSDRAVSDVAAFMARHHESFKRTEKLYQVSPHVVASLLWIESRHGQNIGNFHVPSVFIHLLHGERRDVIRYLKAKAPEFATSGTTVSHHQLQDVEVRARRRASWALSELRALAKIRKWRWQIDSAFRGSFSGAFGIAQFIPSSYVKWARSAIPGKQPDLSVPEDAIESTSHYLRDHGWKPEDPATHMTALMKYNNSRDYAQAILNLAEKVAATNKKLTTRD